MEHPLQLSSAVGVPRRVGRVQLARLVEQLSDRDHAVLETVERFRLVRGDQLQRLHFHTIATSTGAARVSRRSLQRLVELRLLARTERRVGGVRPGSTSHTYLLTRAGRRVVALRSGSGAVSDRGLYEPGLAFHAHTLAITELYVRAVEAERAGRLELVVFDPEPSSWRLTVRGGVLKPDAFVIVAAGEFEHASFIEVDLATEGRTTLKRKLDSYVGHHAAGLEQRALGVFPRVLWLAPSVERAAVIASVIATLPVQARRLYATALIADPICSLIDDGEGATP